MKQTDHTHHTEGPPETTGTSAHLSGWNWVKDQRDGGGVTYPRVSLTVQTSATMLTSYCSREEVSKISKDGATWNGTHTEVKGLVLPNEEHPLSKAAGGARGWD